MLYTLSLQAGSPNLIRPHFTGVTGERGQGYHGREPHPTWHCQQWGLRVGNGVSDFGFSASGEPMRGGTRSCLDFPDKPTPQEGVGEILLTQREPRGLSILAVYVLDQIRFLSSSQASNFEI